MNILYTASCGHRSVASIDAGNSRRFHRRLEWCKSVHCKACYLLEIGKRDEAREAALLACEPSHPAVIFIVDETPPAPADIMPLLVEYTKKHVFRE